MISVVIPAYNGSELLAQYLPVLIGALESSKIVYEVIIVDDGSEKMLEVTQPKTRVVRLDRNSGFSIACNSGAKESKYPVLFFLNTDVKVTPHFIEPLLAHLSDPKVFAVAPRILIPDENNFDEAVTSGRLRGSHLLLKIGSKKPPTGPTEILYACGAALLVARDKFWEIGGFDELYKPFYMDDLDLCYQAWKRGYRVIYEPKSAVYHLHSKTIKSYRKRSYIQSIDIRNQYLFRWKNFTDPWLVFLMVLELFTLKLINPNPTEWSGFVKALGRLKEVLARHRELKKHYKLTDKEVFAHFKTLNETT
ncbi:MAG: glycosyltransferase family 2 protein [Candidatus Margulisbacteria bacterium]|nr:glycosyltransferase family 2 protein [Candidatus Margulisiibacteriota bacterium]